MHCRTANIIAAFLLLISTFAAHSGQKADASDYNNELIEIGDFGLSADKIRISDETSEINASGNVFLDAGQLKISADSFSYSKNETLFTLSGKVRLRLPLIEIDAEELRYSAKYAMLEASEASFRLKEKENDSDECKSPDCCRQRAAFSAGSLRRESDGSWTLENSSFTSCDCGEGSAPSWRIEAERIKAQENDSAKAENARFLIRDTTVFALPVAVFPIGTRRSGFLTPRLSYTDANGVRIGEDYFWAFDRSADATFGLDFMHRRGFMGSAESRYNFGRVAGDFDVFYMPDWSASPADNDFNRFSLDGSHTWDSNRATLQKVKLEILSDTQVPQHFGRDWRDRSIDYSESVQMWEFSLQEVSLGFTSSYHQALTSNLRSDGWLWDLNGNSPTYLLNRINMDIPALLLAGGHLLLNLRNSAEIVRIFGQADSLADDDSPPPLSLVSALFDFEPEMTFPFQISDVIEAAPRVSYRQKVFLSDDSVCRKSYATLAFDIQSRIWRVFETKDGAIKHEITPALGWRWLPVSEDDSGEASGTRMLRLMDYPDESTSPHHAEARLTNRLALRQGDFVNGRILRFLEMGLIQRFFIEPAASDPQKRGFDDGRAELILRLPKTEWKNRMGLRWQDREVQSARSSLTFGPFSGVVLGAEYLLMRDGPLLGDWLFQRAFDDKKSFHQAGGNIAWTFAKSFTLGYAVDASIEERKLIEQRWLAAYRSRCNCWGMDLTASHRPGLNFPDVFLNIDLDFL